MLHQLPEYSTNSHLYHSWIGIQPQRKTKNNFIYSDAPLYSNLTKRKLHIGFCSSYMYRYRTETSFANHALFNLYIYKPLLDLYRIRQEELYMQYLHISYEPYYLFIDTMAFSQQDAIGTILYQITKRSYIRKNLP